MDGVLLIDKPSGPTSHDVVDRVRRTLGTRRVGHGGTLDPFATGLVVCLVGRATRLSEYALGHDKRYLAVAVLGERRDTGDRTGDIIARDDAAVSREDVVRAVETFPRTYDQQPPDYSAKKTNGVPAYRLAREGREVRLASVRVEIRSLELIHFASRRVVLRAEVSAGTYMRSLVEDLGRAMGTGAYVEELRRERSGHFSVDQAIGLAEFEALPAAQAAGWLLGCDTAVADFPLVRLAGPELFAFVNGRPVALAETVADGLVRTYGPAGFVGMGCVSEGQLRPQKVLVRDAAGG